MDQPPPKIIVHPLTLPLTPPTTPDRPPVDRTFLRNPNSGTKKTRRKERQVAEMTNAVLYTPQTMPRATRKSDQQTALETPQQQQQQQTPSPSPDEALQARISALQEAMRLSPVYIAEAERSRVIWEREVAVRMQKIKYLARGVDNDDLYPSKTIHKETEEMTFARIYGPGRKGKARVPWVARPRLRTYTYSTFPPETTDTYVAPRNCGHLPGEAWLARREWEMFLRRREEKWGDPEEVYGEDGEGEGEGEAETGVE